MPLIRFSAGVAFHGATVPVHLRITPRRALACFTTSKIRKMSLSGRFVAATAGRVLVQQWRARACPCAFATVSMERAGLGDFRLESVDLGGAGGELLEAVPG